MSVDQIVAALVESILCERCGISPESARSETVAVTRFVLDQFRRMPDYLQFPFKCVTLAFGIWPVMFRGRPFHRLPREQRLRYVRTWRCSAWGVRRDLIRFYEAFIVFGWYSERYPG
jgi:hypothetical protein